MTAAVPELELVIVSYRSRRNIAQLLEGLPADLPVAVVDNAGGEEGLEDLVAERARSRYLVTGGEGFARAANLGARTSACEVVLFVNPDTRPTLSVLAQLARDVLEDADCVSSAANLLDADGQVELGVAGWEPTVRRTFVHAVGLHLRLPAAGLFARPVPDRPLRVDWTSGACMAVRREAFLQLGGFDEAYYVYNEDVAFGRQVRAAGLRQRLRQELLVAKGSDNSGAPSLEMLRLRGAAMTGYLSDHDRRPAAAVMVALLVAGSTVRGVVALARGRRARAREYRAYVLGLLTGRAVVGGREVARARRREVAAQADR